MSPVVPQGHPPREGARGTAAAHGGGGHQLRAPGDPGGRLPQDGGLPAALPVLPPGPRRWALPDVCMWSLLACARGFMDTLGFLCACACLRSHVSFFVSSLGTLCPKQGAGGWHQRLPPRSGMLCVYLEPPRSSVPYGATSEPDTQMQLCVVRHCQAAEGVCGPLKSAWVCPMQITPSESFCQEWSAGSLSTKFAASSTAADCSDNMEGVPAFWHHLGLLETCAWQLPAGRVWSKGLVSGIRESLTPRWCSNTSEYAHQGMLQALPAALRGDLDHRCPLQALPHLCAWPRLMALTRHCHGNLLCARRMSCPAGCMLWWRCAILRHSRSRNRLLKHVLGGMFSQTMSIKGAAMSISCHAGQLGALKHGLVCNTTLAGLGAALLPESGLVNGVTGYIMLPPQAFAFWNGTPISAVRQGSLGIKHSAHGSQPTQPACTSTLAEPLNGSSYQLHDVQLEGLQVRRAALSAAACAAHQAFQS